MKRQSFVRQTAAFTAGSTGVFGLETRLAKAQPAAQYTVTIGTSGGPPVPSEVAIDNWARVVKDRSHGQIDVRVVHNGQLGNEQQLLRSTQNNAIQGGASSNANLDSFTPAMQVYELPYLFKTAAGYFKAWDSAAGQSIKAAVEKALSIKVLMIMDAGGFRSVLTRRKPIRLPPDLAGQKLRIASTPIELATFKNLGVDPVALANAEIFTALQQGTIDGVVLQPTWIFADRLAEIAKYYCDIHYVMYAYLLYVGSDFFATLPKNLQDIVLSAALEEQARERDAAAAAVKAALTGIAGAGVEMHDLTAGERRHWMSATEVVLRDFEGKIGHDLIEAMQRAAS